MEKDLDVRAETIKHIEKNMGKTIMTLALWRLWELELKGK